jgi:two-component system LytT family sensor kinase
MPVQSKPFIFRMQNFPLLFFIFGSLQSYIISTICIYVMYLIRKERSLLQVINIHQEAKLTYLQSQINPHFLFNALNSLYALTLIKSDKAPDLLLNLTDFLRHSLYQKARDMVAIADEIKQIDFLKELYALKSDGQYNISFEKASTEGFVAPMILVPIAENCFKHCDFDLNLHAYIRMELIVDSNGLVFYTENSFASNTPKDPSSGVGMSNIQERLALIYGNTHALRISTANNIYKVELHIQWKAN